MTWQPIETAPTDGTPVLLYLSPPLNTNEAVGWCAKGEMHVVVGWAEDTYRDVIKWCCGFCEEGTADTEGFSTPFMMTVTPTHWMPLPNPPTDR